MAKPVLEEKFVEEILRGFAAYEDGDIPSDGLFKALAKASDKMETGIRERYTQLYQRAHNTDIDPLLPIPPSVG